MRLVGPDNLVVSEYSLAFVVEDPLHSCFLDGVDEIFVSVTHYPLHSLDHFLLQVVEPHFDVEPCADSVN